MVVYFGTSIFLVRLLEYYCRTTEKKNLGMHPRYRKLVLNQATPPNVRWGPSRMPNLDPKLHPEQLIDFRNMSGLLSTIASCHWSSKVDFALNEWLSFDFGKWVRQHDWMNREKDFSVEPQERLATTWWSPIGESLLISSPLNCHRNSNARLETSRLQGSKSYFGFGYERRRSALSIPTSLRVWRYCSSIPVHICTPLTR